MVIKNRNIKATANSIQRIYNSDQKELKVTNVELLQTVKEKSIDRITISLASDMLDEQIVEELSEIISENPGNTKLYFLLRDSQGKNHVLLRAQNGGVDVRHSLIDYIDSHEMLDYKIN